MPPSDPSRRTVLRGGLAALAGLTGLRALERVASTAPLLAPTAPATAGPSVDPILRLASLGPSELVGGLPFAPRWFGDGFPANAIPFHGCENCLSFPDPQESVDVAVVGGGLSGLASAYLLRHRAPVVFELRPRLGGQAMGEAHGGRSWSLASAYFMQPDKGSDLDALYTALGLHRHWRLDGGEFGFEYDGAIGSDLLGPDATAGDILALDRYRAAVSVFANESYPELPFDGEPNRLIRELDARSFAEDLQLRCGALPPRLRYLLQAYCASSLGVGMDELNAAAAWNFVAAEEFGRMVMPAGNAGLARALWSHARAGGARFRCGATVAEITPTRGGSILAWRDADGTPRSTFARQVIMANAKHIARHMLPWLSDAEPAKHEAMLQVPTAAYVVANVLLSRPLERPFYDAYLQGSAGFPMDANAFESARPITDAVNANFAHSTEPHARPHALLAAAVAHRALQHRRRRRLARIRGARSATGDRTARDARRARASCRADSARALGPRDALRGAGHLHGRASAGTPAPAQRQHLVREPGQLAAPRGRDLPDRSDVGGTADRGRARPRLIQPISPGITEPCTSVSLNCRP